MKTKLLYLLLFVWSISFAQIPTDYVARYDFNNGSTDNIVNPGTGDLIGNVAASQLRPDRFTASNNAIRVNAVKYSGYIFTGVNNEVSVSFWIQGSAPGSGSQRIFQVFDGNGDGFDMYTKAGSILRARITNDVVKTSEITNTGLYTGNWNHIVITIKKTNSGYDNTVYINGVENTTMSTQLDSSSSSDFLTSNARFIISPLSPNSGSYYGQIDDIRIYDRELSATEASNLANESANTVTLTTNIVGGGTITVNPSPVNGFYYHGQVVTLSATADPGQSFLNWSGDVNSTATQVTVLMDADKTVTATFDTACTTTGVIGVPDSNFLNALLNHTPVIDTNGDNQIQCSEAIAFTGNLYFAASNVSDVTGLEHFVNITRISGWNNSITEIDLSNNTQLTQVLLSQNDIEDIDISMLPLVTDFKAHSNELTQLNLANGNNSNFTRMEAQGNSNLTCIQVDNGFTPSGWNSGGVSYSYNCYVSLSNPEFELADNTLRVYPNPTSTILNIESNATITNVEVYDLLGKKVLESQEVSIDVSSLHNGMYLLKVKSDNGITTKRFVKR